LEQVFVVLSGVEHRKAIFWQKSTYIEEGEDKNQNVRGFVCSQVDHPCAEVVQTW